MREVYKFLKKCRTYYLATVEDDQPRVRPFGSIDLFEDRLYILTGRNKAVSEQISKNPKAEICAYDGDKWIRVQAVLVEDGRIEPKRHMLDAFPVLRDTYKADDSNTQVFYLKDAVATVCSFDGEPVVIEF